jgi:hypothetical protein
MRVLSLLLLLLLLLFGSTTHMMRGTSIGSQADTFKGSQMRVLACWRSVATCQICEMQRHNIV